MKKKLYLLTAVITLVFSFSSCKVSKDYVQHVSKKQDIKEPTTKKVLVIATNKVDITEFEKTFDKNYNNDRDFAVSFLEEFSEKLNNSSIYADVTIDSESSSYVSIPENKSDYTIHFSKFEISNRVEWTHTAGMGVNGLGSSTSTEYCVITVKVEVYDSKTDREVLDFITIGEESVFLFDYTKTLKKAKERTILHIINYLQTGRISYEKY